MLSKIIPIKGNIQLTVLERGIRENILQSGDQSVRQKDPARLDADQICPLEVIVVFDQRITEAIQNHLERLAGQDNAAIFHVPANIPNRRAFAALQTKLLSYPADETFFQLSFKDTVRLNTS